MTQFSFTAARAALLVTLAALSAPTAHAQNSNSYVVTDLGAASGSSIFVGGLNNKGQVVGLFYRTTDTEFVWTPSSPNATTGTSQDIGNQCATNDLYLPKINDSGLVMGTTYSAHGYLWTKDTGVQYIASSSDSAYGATDINNEGQVSCVMSGSPNSALWQNGTFSYITVSGNSNRGTYTISYGLNDYGQVVGEARLFDSSGNYIGPNAFLWQNGVTQLLGTPPGYSGSIAEDVNDKGQVIGRAGTTNGWDSFLWQNGIFTMLGSGQLGDGSVAAGAINNAGDIVGYLHSKVNSNIIPSIWHKGTWYSLDGTASYTNDPLQSGSARGINDSGQIIVQSNETGTGYLLTPNIVLAGVAVSPAPVAAGTTATGKVTLKYPVFVDTQVTLANTNPLASVPASVIVPALKTFATFPITTTAGTATGTLTAKAVGPSGNITKSVTLAVGPVDVDKLTLSPTTITGGVNVTATLTLNGPAPSGGLSVALSTSAANVARPASATFVVPAGAKTATFIVQTFPTSSPTSVTLLASAAGITRTASLRVNPGLQSVTVSPDMITGGSSSTGTVILSGPAASNLTVALSSSSPSILSVPTSVVVSSGATSATFPVTTYAVTASTTVTVSAKVGLIVTKSVTVTP